MHYSPIAVNASESQLLESRKFNVEDIARFFGIPAIMLTGEQAGNLESAQNQFMLHCLSAYIEMFNQEFTNKLFPDSNLIVQLDTTALMKTDKTALANYYNTLITNGVLCPNEVRKELGYAPVDGLDKHTIAYTDINQNTLNNTEDESK
ncbi:MAG: phage portal protein [Bacteroidales bacterium]|nr:phage portal protein [Bacteroidales bacterium]MBD5235146.1 phage portal protein [Barnesiella sp.]MBD5257383.1 phage portal protein [Barnesiella sp.]